MTRARTRLARVRVIALSLASGLTISVAALALVPVAIATLFRARRLYAAVAACLARLLLRFWSIRVLVHRDHGLPAFPRTQAIYVSNHSSTLDLFVRWERAVVDALESTCASGMRKMGRASIR